MKANQLSNYYDDPRLQTEFENIYLLLNKVGLFTGDRDTAGQRAENIDMYVVDVTASSTANDDNQITHDLLKVANFYTILTQSASADFYEGSGTNSDTSFFIKSSGASTRFTIGLW